MTRNAHTRLFVAIIEITATLALNTLNNINGTEAMKGGCSRAAG